MYILEEKDETNFKSISHSEKIGLNKSYCSMSQKLLHNSQFRKKKKNVLWARFWCVNYDFCLCNCDILHQHPVRISGREISGSHVAVSDHCRDQPRSSVSVRRCNTAQSCDLSVMNPRSAKSTNRAVCAQSSHRMYPARNAINTETG